MPEMRLSQLDYLQCLQASYYKKKKKKEKKRDLRNIYQNELERAHFQNDMLYRDFEDLARRKYYVKRYLMLLKSEI